MKSNEMKPSEVKSNEMLPNEMVPKKLTFEKEVVSRLQDEEMSHIMGASSHSNTSVSKESDELTVETSEKDEDKKSCCQKSCNGGK